MQKTRVAIIAVLLAFALLFYFWTRAEVSRAYALRAACRSIATDLLTNTNSERVAVVDDLSSRNFSAFLAVPARLGTVKLGDEPRVLFFRKLSGLRRLFDFRRILDSTDQADARLYFTNQSNKHFQIFIRSVKSPTNYTVIGAGWD